MSPIRRASLVGVLLLAVAQASGQGASGPAAAASLHHARLGPLAQAVLSVEKNGHHLPTSRVRGRATRHGTTFGVFLRGRTSGAAIATTGAAPGTVLDVGATADATLAELPALAVLPGVTEVELAGTADAQLDQSVPAVHASEPGHANTAGVPHLWSVAGTSPLTFAGTTGKTAVVGVVDTGIDLSNTDFQTGSGTRIFELWDQAACSNPSAGSCPQQPPNSQGFTYGAECSQSVITTSGCGPFSYGGDCETPYTGGTPVALPEQDCNGHGTHVAGTAAANGSAGNAGTYIGVAPEANLVIVKSDFDLAHAVDAVAYVNQVAAAHGLPASVNLSLGTNFGPHDGTDTFEQMLDALTGPGRLLSVAAGNQATSGSSYHYHASATLAAGAVKAESLRVATQPVFIDLWYPGSDSISVAMNEQGVGQTGWVSPSVAGTANLDGTCNQYSHASAVQDTQHNKFAVLSCTAMPGSLDNEIQIELYNPDTAGHTLKSPNGALCDSTQNCLDVFQIQLRGDTAPHGPFNAWMFNQGDYYFHGGDGNDISTIDEPATAHRVLTVGSYVDRTSWPSQAGTKSDPYGTQGQLSFFSASGPTRDGRNGISLVAPGEVVGSSLSANAAASVRSSCPVFTVPGCTSPDGKHLFLFGTSAAAPHVTGALALLLAQRPGLTPDQATRVLADAADTSPVTGGGPVQRWGGGKLQLGPGILSITPRFGAIAGGTGISIAGVDLQTGVTMSLGGKSLALTRVAANQYTAKTPTGSAAGPVDLVITNPDHSTALDAHAFTYGSPPNVGLHNAVLINGGTPVDWYYDAGHKALRRARWTGSGWDIVTTDGPGSGSGAGQTTDDVGRYISTIIWQGVPHVWYYDLTAGALRHAWWNGSRYTRETLDGTGGTAGQTTNNAGLFTSVAVFNGAAHVWYYDATAHNLRHAWWNGTGWAFEILDGAGSGSSGGRTADDVGQFSAAIIYNGAMHVWYYDATAHSLRHAVGDGSAWTFETLDGTGAASGSGQTSDNVGQYNSVTLYNGGPHIWYYDAAAHSLRHGFWNGTGWSFETVDGAGVTGRPNDDVGKFTSVTVYAGAPHVWYYDATAFSLHQAWLINGAWYYETLDGGGSPSGGGQTGDQVGQFSAVTLFNGTPHVWYYDASARSLRYGWWGLSQWEFETIDSG
jgi:subtilisin family serine protease